VEYGVKFAEGVPTYGPLRALRRTKEHQATYLHQA
jgi:hypothetical protein